MNLDHLRYFETIARLEHYGKAAELLHTTQPNLTHAISQLEAELEVPLFEKCGRNVRLTRYGKAFLDTVSHSLDHLDQGVHALKAVRQGGGLIILGCTRELGTSVVPFLMRDFQQTPQGQHVTFQLHTGSSFSDSLLKLTLDGSYDMVFTSRPGDNTLLDSTAFPQSPFVAAVSPQHPLAGLDAVTVRQTLAYPHIFFSREAGLRAAVSELFYQTGAFPEISYETEEDFVAAGLAAAGFGVAILPDHPFLRTMDLVLLPITEPDPARSAYLSIARNVWHSQAVGQFYDFCRDRLPEFHVPMHKKGL